MPCSPSSNAITTVDRVKLELGITDVSKDEIICEKINAYSDAIEGLLGRKLQVDDYVETYPGSNDQHLLIDNFPINNIVSLSVNDEVLDTDDYKIVGYLREMIFKDDGWEQINYVSGMSRSMAQFSKHTIDIEYNAGYVMPNDGGTRTLPYDIEQVILDFISMDLAQEGTTKGLKRFKISDVSWDFIDAAGMTNQTFARASKTLHKYKSFSL